MRNGYLQYVSAGLLIGLLIGFAAGTVAFKRTDPTQSFAKECMDKELVWADSNLMALSSLQDRDIDGALKTLQLSLSLNAVVFHEFVTTVQPNSKLNRMLLRIASYRERYPYRLGDHEADAAIDEILQLAQTRTARDE